MHNDRIVRDQAHRLLVAEQQKEIIHPWLERHMYS